MEAIILAGGFGTRLRPLTYTRAKSLLPILNKPMISYLIESLPPEVDRVVLAVNYRKGQIEEYFADHDCGRELIVNDEPTPLGTAGAVKFAEEYLTGRFFVLNADIICSLSLSEMIRFHRNHGAVASISLWPVEHVSEFGVADAQQDGKIVGFVEKPRPEDAPSNLINAGAYLLEPEVLEYIETGRLVSMEKEIFPQIITDTGKFYGFVLQGYWMDIGRISSYLEVHQFLLRKHKFDNYVGEHCKVGGHLHHSCLGNHVTIGKNAQVHSSIIYDNVHVGEGVTLSDCVIGENVRIGQASTLKKVVVGDNEIVHAQTSLEQDVQWTQSIPKEYPKKQIGNPLQSS
ncbi:MAG: NDP-sugar synthase [Candidatus Thermoplasmatota archaeon]|nr:NDP-sugar synthase [Candidatus Thermoplasmatota archaeon]